MLLEVFIGMPFGVNAEKNITGAEKAKFVDWLHSEAPPCAYCKFGNSHYQKSGVLWVSSKEDDSHEG